MTFAKQNRDTVQMRADIHFLLAMNATKGPDRTFYREALRRYLGGSEEALQETLSEYRRHGESFYDLLLEEYAQFEQLLAPTGSKP